MKDIKDLVNKLCVASVDNALDLNSELKWPDEISLDNWFMSEELVSIFGMKEYSNLSEDTKKKLSFYELLNFFSVNIHGERHLMSGMSMLLYSPIASEFSEYLHHFLNEENHHMEYFARFCRQYGKKIYPDTLQSALPYEYKKGEQEFLYFAKVMIFEECLDRYNVHMSKDAKIPQIVRDINRVHHIDESRHLAFGRRVTQEIFNEYSPKWGEQRLAQVRKYVGDYLESFWRDLFNSRVYKDAGISGDVFDLRDRAYQGERAYAHYQALTLKIEDYLLRSKILIEKPRPTVTFENAA